MASDPDEPQRPSSESTTPASSELTSPYDTKDLLEVDHGQVRQVLEQLATTPLHLRSDNLVPRPWGGQRLIEFKGLQGATRPGRYGESFEIAAYPLDHEAARNPSIVEFADGSSMRLSELLGRAGEAVLGAEFISAYGLCIPLLPKFLDIAGLLSVQTHPRGQAEAYVIIEAEPGATIRVGFRHAIDPAAMTERLRAARAQQELLPDLLWMSETSYAPMLTELLGKPDAVRRLSERLKPMLREQADLPRLLAALEVLETCYREMLDALTVIPVKPGMVVFNADPPGALQTELPSSQVHCLGNPEGRSILMLEIRRPGPTYRAWDHVRFPLRELEIDEAFAAMTTAPTRPEQFVVEPRPLPDRPGVLRSVECPAFVIDHLRPQPGVAIELQTAGRPTTLHGIRGVARALGQDGQSFGLIRAGESWLLPAGLTCLRLEAQTPDAELVQVTIPLPERVAGEDEISTTEPAPEQAKRQNLERLRGLAGESLGPTEVIAIVNGGDAETMGKRLRELSTTIFRADGDTQIFMQQELERRGQLLGLLDALRSHRATHGGLDPDRVALGIMLPGKGTRLEPLTARMHGIKPLFPMPIRQAGPHGPVWLDGAGASLWTWTLVGWTLERQGFRGIAWKWGDEAQIAGRRLSTLDYDLADVDAVRFGARATPSEDLASNKEWLLVDPQTGDLVQQLRRRPLAQLQARLDALSEEHTVPDNSESHRSALEPYVHVGSPAFSHLFLTHAEQVFGKLQGWIDVDGYLFEALTHNPVEWAAEVARDPELARLLQRCPDFYERVVTLRRRIEADRGYPLRIVVVDFGPELYWGDIGQLGKAREVWANLVDESELGVFARSLAGLDGIEPDAHGNLLIGESSVPDDGSVRGCVIIDSTIRRGSAERAVVVRSSLGIAGLEPGAVALNCRVDAMRMGAESLAFGSIGEYLRVPSQFVHTSVIDDPRTPTPRLDSYFADMRADIGSSEVQGTPMWGNPTSFSLKFEQMRQREVELGLIEGRIAKLGRRHGGG
jgi:hypothetical protein